MATALPIAAAVPAIVLRAKPPKSATVLDNRRGTVAARSRNLIGLVGTILGTIRLIGCSVSRHAQFQVGPPRIASAAPGGHTAGPPVIRL